MKDKTIPSYYITRIYFIGLTMFMFMILSVIFFVIIKNTPAIISSISASVSSDVKERFQERGYSGDVHLLIPSLLKSNNTLNNFHLSIFHSGSLSDTVTLIILFIGFIVTLIINYPIRKFFILKRKHKEIPDNLFKYVNKIILKTPIINTAIIFISLLFIYLSQSFILLRASGIEEMYRSFYFQLISISVIAGDLWLLFAFFWQRSRVQRLYIDHIFTSEELKVRNKSKLNISISARFIISSLMTTVFPLASVLFYVILSFSTVDTVKNMNNDQLRLLIGNVTGVFDTLGITDIIFSDIRNGTSGVFKHFKMIYVNSFDSLQMLTGIIIGVIISLIYVFLFVRWTALDILIPIKDLLNNINKTRNGDLQSFTIVRSNDEIGELSEGYNTMLTGLQEREKIKNLFGQYLTKEISDEILKGNVNLSGELYDATVMFCDIRDFTAMSEKITPAEVFSFLNAYLDRMIDVILENNGIIDKFIGDGILAIFGVPIRSDKHAGQAVNAAIAMNNALIKLNAERELNGHIPIRIGIGLHTGKLIAGNIGNFKKLEYTVIGDTVNIASRIEKLTKEHSTSLLLSEMTYNLLNENLKSILSLEKIGNVPIRGKDERINLYKIN
ncbi:MAG: hypothetical protein A2015_03390 [Spirochaetes bacterium GWF1_31_7]|nr:MAG: hypothetical protein A2Y30_07475 [Spirochaetes bacterium GWE1_32_154]OHD48425.1 MAG: hypothetical protein A2Y29_05350 [Spirochaetes bacterium GWE2_31_10]OHD50901.1 MAG: hypothetical protein A2015_03390 [Spirochaetes bacterium GWF1_31_7]OHD79578.1 MAG: hypothetical protein A2355_03870 [Spirochaetes bacterium RIFOXYB1_FULL_32_8]HBD92740.1 hypothetical protein [Spirochaetia bacterium]